MRFTEHGKGSIENLTEKTVNQYHDVYANPISNVGDQADNLIYIIGRLLTMLYDKNLINDTEVLEILQL